MRSDQIQHMIFVFRASIVENNFNEEQRQKLGIIVDEMEEINSHPTNNPIKIYKDQGKLNKKMDAFDEMFCGFGGNPEPVIKKLKAIRDSAKRLLH